MHDLSSSNERRKYFRVRNKLFLSYLLDQTKNDGLSGDLSNDQKTKRQASPQITLLRELSEMNDKNKYFLSTLPPTQESTYSHVQTMNNRIIELSRKIICALDIDESSMMDVDISGGGLGFESNKKFSVDQHLNIELILMPQYFGIALDAKVIDCSSIEKPNSYRTSIEFTEINESDRDAIIGYVFKTQSKILRNTIKSED